MEDLTNFLTDLSTRGIRLWAREGRLQFRAPMGVMTPEIRAAVTQRKPEILAVLGGPVFHARGAPTWTPILRYYHSYWRQLQAGEFDIGFTNGTFFVVKYKRPLDPYLLKDRVVSLAARHSILRARVVESDDIGFLFDQPPESLLKIVDLSCHPGASSPEVIKSVVSDLVWDRFDSLKGPMSRVFAVRLNASEHLLGVVVHHFICDGLSLDLLSRELLSGPSMHGSPPLQYSDYILGMNEWVDGTGLQRRMEYWKEQLRNAPATRLPPDFDCDPDATAELNVDHFAVHENVASSLSRLAQRKQTTLFTVFLAAKMSAFAYLLGTPDVVVLVQHHHRHNPTLLSVVGAITDRLPVRAHISIQRSFEENLLSVHDALKAAYALEVPYPVLDDALPDIGASGIAPALNFLDFTAETDASATTDREIEPFEVIPAPKHGSARKHAAHWMTVACTGSGIHGSVGYSAALYGRETFARLIAVLCSVLQGIAEDPGRDVVDLCNRSRLDATRSNHERYATDLRCRAE